jgi:hypothetical protein
VTDPRDQVWEDRAERVYSDLTYRPVRTAAKYWVTAILIIAGLGLLGGVYGIVHGYGSEAKRVIGVENVKEQNTQVIADWQGMQAAATIACSVKDTARGASDPTIIENPSVSYRASYLRPMQDYNRRMANLYEAQAVRGLPLPSNLKEYPKVAPTLAEMQAQVC